MFQLFELTGANGRRFSPYCWRTRMALAHKGLEAEIVPCRFTDKARIAFSGQGKVPVLVHEGTVVADSWRIAEYLEKTFPAAPSLFAGESGRALSRFVNLWADMTLHPLLLRLIVKDIHDRVDPADKAYFRSTREQRLGATLETLHAARGQQLASVNPALQPLSRMLAEFPFLSGEKPHYADYVVFGTFQWVRCASPIQIIDHRDPIFAWRERMLDLFDGLGRRQAAA